MPQLYVHIGTHKTGTTSIQTFLKAQENSLARQGLYVLQTGQIAPASAGQHNIGWALRGDPRADERFGTLDELVTELNTARPASAIMSSEDLEYLVEREDLLTTFEAHLAAGGWTPHYILFLRNPAEHAVSLYHELLKHGDPEDFASFVNEILETGCKRSHGDWVYYFDYPLFIERWRSATRGAMTVLSYDAACRGRGVIETLLDTLGAPPTLADARAPRSTRWQRLLQATGFRQPPPLQRMNVDTRTASEEMQALANRIGAAYPLPHHLFGTFSAT